MALEKRKRNKVEVVEKEESITRSEVVETEEEVWVPICDFCEQEYPEKGKEYLQTVVLNPRVEKRSSLKEDIRIPMDDTFNQTREIFEALQQSRLVDFRRMPVQEIEPPSMVAELSDFEKRTRMNKKISENMIAYRFEVKTRGPKVGSDGEIEICEFCAEIFNND